MAGLNNNNLTSDFWLDVTRNEITGMSRFAYGGNILDLSSGDGIRDIWNGPGNRTVLTGATTLYVSSTDAGDDALIAIAGMDDDYNDITTLATLSGQSQVQLSADTWKTFTMIAISGTANGALYLAESDTLTGGVPDTDSKIQLVGQLGFGSGAIANRTVPVGKTLYVTTLEITPNKGKDVTAYLSVESETQSRFINPASFELFQYGINKEFKPMFTIPEKTDLMIVAKTTDENAPVSTLIEGVLVDN